QAQPLLTGPQLPLAFFRRLPTGLFFTQAVGTLLGPLPFGQVPGDLREAPQLPGLVVEGGDDDVGPKPGAVFTDSPALVLESAFRRRPPQLLGGPAALDGFRRVEAGEVLADNLVGPVAVDALGS